MFLVSFVAMCFGCSVCVASFARWCFCDVYGLVVVLCGGWIAHRRWFVVVLVV